jgi:serine O-acetyltransferase
VLRGSTDERLRGQRSFRATAALIRDDYGAYGQRAWALPGFQALAVHRFGMWADGLRRGRKVARVAYMVLWRLVASIYGIELSQGLVQVGRRLVIGHQGGIVVGASEIGDDCVIRQGVTVGIKRPGGDRPVLGDRVDVGAGAVIIGGVRIGNDVKIGANAVVTEDVADGSRVFAPKSVVVRPRPSA